MKKLVLIVALALVGIAVTAQSVITFKNGVQMEGSIEAINADRLQFNGTKINVNALTNIDGNISDYHIKELYRKNPDILINGIAKPTKPIVQKPLPIKRDYRYYRLETPGDLIAKSSRLRLTGMGVAFGTGILGGVLAVENPEIAAPVLIVGSLAATGFYIAGEVVQIKAGRLMNEQVIIEPSKEGLGLSVNF